MFKMAAQRANDLVKQTCFQINNMLHSTIFSGILLQLIDLSYFDFPCLVKLNVNFIALQGISEFLISALLVIV